MGAVPYRAAYLGPVCRKWPKIPENEATLSCGNHSKGGIIINVDPLVCACLSPLALDMVNSWFHGLSQSMNLGIQESRNPGIQERRLCIESQHCITSQCGLSGVAPPCLALLHNGDGVITVPSWSCDGLGPNGQNTPFLSEASVRPSPIPSVVEYENRDSPPIHVTWSYCAPRCVRVCVPGLCIF